MMSGIELNELIAKVTGNSSILLPQMLPQVKVSKTLSNISKLPTVYNCM